MRRSRVNPRKDRRMFRKTANRMTRSNFPSYALRGGMMK